MKLSIVIPVYNESETITELYRRLSGTLKKLPQEHEIIFIDDGSTDATFRCIHELAEKDQVIRGISFSRNFGHQVAVSAGIEHAGGDAIIIMDGDLQDPPEIIPAFIEKFKQGFDVVYGVRKKRKEKLWKRASYLIF